MRTQLLTIAILVLSACGAEAPTETPADAAAPVTEAGPAPAPVSGTPAPASTASDSIRSTDPATVLAGKAWRVERRSDGGEVGASYAFLADGTLVVDSPNGTPMRGSWTVDGGALSLTEEGIAYATDLVVRDADHVTLRSHNPGGVIEIALVREPDTSLPAGG